MSRTMNAKIKSKPQPGSSDTSDSAEHDSDGGDQRQQEVRAHTAASRGESRPILIQELQGHAVGPTKAQLQQEERRDERRDAAAAAAALVLLLFL